MPLLYSPGHKEIWPRADEDSLGFAIAKTKKCLKCKALAGVAQWIEHQPVDPKVAGSISSQGTRLGCGLGLR